MEFKPAKCERCKSNQGSTCTVCGRALKSVVKHRDLATEVDKLVRKASDMSPFIGKGTEYMKWDFVTTPQDVGEAKFYTVLFCSPCHGRM